MKRRIGWLMIIVLYIAGIGCLATPTYAEETSAEQANGASPLGFTYKVIQPENQQNYEVGYFDLRMTPGQQQTVEIQLTNEGEEPLDIAVSLNGTKTNGNGVIEYGPSPIDNDKSLKYDFSDLVKAPETVTVPGKSMVPLQLEITMPEATYDGVISGGIQLKKVVDEEARKKQSGVINEYAFMVGMILTETDTVVEPNLELNEVYAGLSNYRNSIFVNFSNVEAAYLENLTMEVQIMTKDSDTVLYDTKKANMRVAPNSMVDFAVSMNGEKMVPGEYRAKVVGTSGERKWEWEEGFTITDEDADKYNKQDVELTQEEGINWLLVGGIAGGMLIIAVIIFFIVHIIRKQKETKKKALRKQRKAKRK
ncbi:DUF916 and DUF3324 domain-containing protein [Enterococcus sp. BWB1-3]|uniref:DUF916 and DUF3324 domain-containing protein n=1 Tax=unclassified Enterococcus TaxID=2608891 RepID=UPI0019229278|nr:MULTISPECIES: DUF916 and DUF3324 domain-containing protein [unclassified Enterococcus]MBL1229909.1 DUF916 and DUF3324 domain-containing protein [Enterococcus sp. BWB1-3]MCB5951425.1 DUF916 and DUF3324 domain-containing protein [Enterococcus sp. BWT-B8]MCB5954984.1 DUF916 and DUF3324 domain-containing protein [Enterococcus sp. CWB-B31]